MNKNAIKTIIKEKQLEIKQLKLVYRPFSYEDSMCYVVAKPCTGPEPNI